MKPKAGPAMSESLNVWVSRDTDDIDLIHMEKPKRRVFANGKAEVDTILYDSSSDDSIVKSGDCREYVLLDPAEWERKENLINSLTEAHKKCNGYALSDVMDEYEREAVI